MVRSVQYRGVTYKYRNVAHLAEQLNMTRASANKLINGDGRRLVIVPQQGQDANNVEIININENFTGLLRRFGVTRTNLRREQVVNPPRIGMNLQNDRTLVSKIPSNEQINVYLRVTAVGFFSTNTDGGFDKLVTKTYRRKRPVTRDQDGKFNHAGAVNLETRTVTSKVNLSPSEINEHVYSYGGSYPYYDWWLSAEDQDEAWGRIYTQQKNASGMLADYFRDIPGFIYDYTIQVFTHRWNKEEYETKTEEEQNEISDNELIFEDQVLRAPSSYLLEDWTKIEYSLTEGPDSCVVNYVTNVFPKLHREIKHLARKPVTLKRFKKFMKINTISYNIYNVLGQLIKTHSIEDDIGMLTMIVYNNHVYPISGTKPVVSRARVQKVRVVDNILDRLTKLLDAGIVPKKINVANSTSVKDAKDLPVRSFIHKNIKYICNPEYHKCEDILDQCGIDTNKYMTDDITLEKLIQVYMKANNLSNPLSFLPNNKAYKAPACLWKTNKRIRVKDVVTIDKNKCYSYILQEMAYVYSFDYRCDAIIDLTVNGEGVSLDTYSPGKMYVACPAKWSILMPCTKLYTGEYLAKCKVRGIKFVVTEELHAHQVFNPYRGAIKVLRRAVDDEIITWDDFKTTINVLIGKMEMSCRKKCTRRFTGIFDNEAAEYQASYKTRISPEYQLGFEAETSWSNARNRFPISVQIKDEARMLIYDKIVELGLGDEDIVQINTDSISYYGTLPDGLDPDNFDGWKSSKFSELSVSPDVFDVPVSVLPNTDYSPTTLPALVPRILHIKYAGAGKTYDIIENLVPRIVAEGKSYIVLTPTHKTLEEYIRKDINAAVIQTYVYSGDIPTEDYVIIDEIGFIGAECHDVLFKIAIAGKSLECYGDFNQLPPPDSDGKTYNQEHYLNYLFNRIDTEFTNMRNTFTTEYYDKLINSDSRDWLIKQVRKYSTKSYKDAEKVVCYSHSTRRYFNELMMAHHGFETIWEIGCRIMCTNNKLVDEYGICNRMELEIVKLHVASDGSLPADENITVRNVHSGVKYKVPFGDFYRGKFEAAYAINVHQLQGSTVDSYYWAKKDDMYLTARAAYVIISRLRVQD